MQRLLDGYSHFRTEVFPHHSSLFAQLAHGQTPEVALITCSDSRVMPEMLLQSSPGQVFPIRNAGNLVPPPGEAHSGVGASIEYAVRVLHVRDIIVCGHSGCGAMKAILDSGNHAAEHNNNLPMVHAWLRHAGPSARWLTALFEDTQGIPAEKKLRLLIQANVMTQLSHLAQHASVAEGLADGTLNLHGWVYDIPSGEILELDGESGVFVPLATTAPEQDRKVA
jgi:carbonic anhydrase